MNWYCKTFNDLSLNTLYDLLKLRCDVFVVEQDCPYPELDELDRLPETRHLYAIADGRMAAYARILPIQASYPLYSSIGRVVVAPQNRKDKLGHALVQKSVTQAMALWPEIAIKIGAQSHLEAFYQSHGFATVSQPYLEDGIEHISMLHQALKQDKC